MSFAQYMTLKKGPLPLKKGPLYFTHATQKILLAESNLNFYFVWKFASA